MPGARCARSLACKIKKHTSVVTTVTPATPGIPRTMVYGFLRALPGEPRSFATVAGGYYRQLDTGVRVSGPHDFAVRMSARSSARCLASTASRPASVTIASRPLWKERDGASIIQKFDLVKLFSENQKQIEVP
jgi:hypothetical protein